MKPIAERIAEELNVRPAQVAAAVGLLDEGSTVPFIARYRKEVTGALDDTQLRTLENRLDYLREIEDAATTCSIRSGTGQARQGTGSAVLEADNKARLEDIYLPSSQSAAPRRRSPGKRASSRWPTRCSPPRARAAGSGRTLRQARRGQDGAGRARRRAGDPDRAVRRGRRADRPPARGFLAGRPDRLKGPRGQGGGRGEVLGLFRLLRAAREDPLASGAGADARRSRGNFGPRARPRPSADPASRTSARSNSRSPIASPSPTAAGRATGGSSTPPAGRGGPRSRPSSRSRTSGSASGPRPRTRR